MLTALLKPRAGNQIAEVRFLCDTRTQCINYPANCHIRGRWSTHAYVDKNDTDVNNKDVNIQQSSDVIQFRSEGDIQHNEIMSPYQSELLADYKAGGTSDIHDVFSRDIAMGSFEWKTSHSHGEELHRVSCPDDIIKSSANLRLKLSHYNYMRCNVRLRFVANQTPYVQGKIFAFSAPMDAYAGPGRGSNPIQVPFSMTPATAHNGVEFDIAASSSAELVIPYISPYTAMDLVSGDGRDWATVYIHVLNELKSALSEETVEVTVFARLEDVEIAIPSSAPINRVFSRLEDLPSCDELCHLDYLTTIAECGDYECIVDASRKYFECEEKCKEEYAKAVANPRYRLHAKELPDVTTGAQTPGWVSRMRRGVASVLGCAKPQETCSTQATNILPARGYTNTNGTDQSVVLGGFTDNAITPQALFGTTQDEMDIAYVAGKSQYIEKFDWPVNEARGTLLGKFPVTPAYAKSSATEHFVPREIATPSDTDPTTKLEGICYHVTNGGYVASMHKYWSGTMKYHLSVAKTAFHSGRLRVTWVPGHMPSAKVETPKHLETLTVAPSSSTWIMDLRDTRDFEFTVPWPLNSPVLPVRAGPQEDDPRTLEASSFNGWILLTVETPLKAVDKVCQTIDINLWQACDKDITFHVPDFSTYTPFLSMPLATGEPFGNYEPKPGIVDAPTTEVHYDMKITLEDLKHSHTTGDIFTINSSSDVPGISHTWGDRASWEASGLIGMFFRTQRTLELDGMVWPVYQYFQIIGSDDEFIYTRTHLSGSTPAEMPAVTGTATYVTHAKYSTHSATLMGAPDSSDNFQHQAVTPNVNVVCKGSTKDKDDTLIGQTVFGETHTNLRSLSKRFGVISYFDTNWDDKMGQKGTHCFDTANFNSMPAYHMINQLLQTVTLEYERKMCAQLSPVRIISYLYRFYRGGRRFKFLSSTGKPHETNPMRVQLTPQWAPNTVVINSGHGMEEWFPDAKSRWSQASKLKVIPSVNNCFSNINFPCVNPTNEVMVPYTRPLRMSTITDSMPENGNSRPYILFERIGGQPKRDKAQDVVFIMDAAADDMTFGAMIGAPAIISKWDSKIPIRPVMS